jgi:hypothetical protein
MSPRYTKYELKLTATTDDGAKAIACLSPFLAPQYPTIAAANAKRRAIGELYGEHVKVEVVSVQRIPARTRRRVLKL